MSDTDTQISKKLSTLLPISDKELAEGITRSGTVIMRGNSFATRPDNSSKQSKQNLPPKLTRNGTVILRGNSVLSAAPAGPTTIKAPSQTVAQQAPTIQRATTIPIGQAPIITTIASRQASATNTVSTNSTGGSGASPVPAIATTVVAAKPLTSSMPQPTQGAQVNTKTLLDLQMEQLLEPIPETDQKVASDGLKVAGDRLTSLLQIHFPEGSIFYEGGYFFLKYVKNQTPRQIELLDLTDKPILLKNYDKVLRILINSYKTLLPEGQEWAARVASCEYKFNLMPKPEYAIKILEKLIKAVKNNPSLMKEIYCIKIKAKPSVTKYLNDVMPTIVIYPYLTTRSVQIVQDALLDLVSDPELTHTSSGLVPRNGININANPLLFYSHGGDAMKKLFTPEQKTLFLTPSFLHYSAVIAGSNGKLNATATATTASASATGSKPPVTATIVAATAATAANILPQVEGGGEDGVKNSHEKATAENEYNRLLLQSFKGNEKPLKSFCRADKSNIPLKRSKSNFQGNKRYKPY